MKSYANVSKSQKPIARNYEARDQSRSFYRSDDSEDFKKDAMIMRKANERDLLPRAIISDSEDDACIVNDDSEEGNVGATHFSGGDIGGSFRVNSDSYGYQFLRKQKQVINEVNSLVISKVSSKKAIPTFSSVYGSSQKNRERPGASKSEVYSDEDDSVSHKSIRESLVNVSESKREGQ